MHNKILYTMSYFLVLYSNTLKYYNMNTEYIAFNKLT